MNTKTRSWTALCAGLIVAALAQSAAAQGTSAHAVAGRNAGKQHAVDLGKRNLATNYVNCGIRGYMAMATAYKVVTDQERTAFINGFESTCVGEEARKQEPVGQLIPAAAASK